MTTPVPRLLDTFVRQAAGWRWWSIGLTVLLIANGGIQTNPGVAEATEESVVVDSHVREVSVGADSPEEHRKRFEAIEKARREMKRALAVLGAENGTDPTAIIGQLSPRTRYQDRASDQRVQEIARLSLPLSPDWLLRLDMPFTYLDPKDTNDKAVAGLGDLRARLGWRILNKEDGAIFIGSELAFPTATNPKLGSGYAQVGPAIVGSLHLPEIRSTGFVWIEYLTSVSGHLGGGLSGGLKSNDVSTSENIFRFRLSTVWTEKYWSFVEHRLFVDYTKNAKTGSVLMFEGGRRLDSNWRIYFRPEVGLWGRDVPGAYYYGFELGFRYMFYRF